jgi:hypothetical protein
MSGNEIQATAGPAPDTGSRDSGAPPVRPARRRWPRRLALTFFVIALLLILLVGFAPRIASTQTVTGFAVSLLNDRLEGEVQIDGLSLSWRGPCEVRSLRVSDPARREVLQSSRITYIGGLWHLLTSPAAFEEITIDSPRIVLHVTADNEVTLAHAFRPRKPAAPGGAAPGPLPEPRGRVIIRDGAVRISRDAGPAYDVPDLDGQIDIQSLAEIAAKLELALTDGSQLEAEAAIGNLVTGDKLSLSGATGKLSVRTEGAIDVGPLAEIAAPGSGLEARTELTVDATIEEGAVQAAFTTGVEGLQARQREGVSSSPIDLDLTGRVDWAPERVAAQTLLTGGAGRARVSVSYPLADQPASVALDELLSAVFSGAPIVLPDFTVEAEASVDLVALERAVPGLLHIRPGQQITGGQLEVSTLAVRGGSRPSASGSIKLQDLTTATEQRTTRLEPVSLGFDAALETGRGLDIRHAELQSSFARIVASGVAADLRASFDSDLVKLRHELGQVFELGSFELAGSLGGTLELSRTSDERVELALEVTADGASYGDDDRRVELPRARLRQTGYVMLADEQVTRLVATEASVDLNGELRADASGWYDLKQRAFHADIDTVQADLGFASSRAATLGLSGLDRYAGTLLAQATIDRTAGDQPITSDGSLVARDLTVDGQALVENEAAISWSGMRLAPTGAQLRVESAQLRSTPAALTASNLRWQAGERLAVDGKIRGSADLAGCLRAAGALAKWEQAPALTGRLSLDASIATADDTVALAGQGAVDQLTIGVGEQALREERVQIEYDARLDQQQDRITIGKTHLASGPLTCDVAGTIEQVSTTGVLALSGRYDASWERITALLHEIAPATADTVVLKGRSKSEFTVTGPMRQPGATPPYRGVESALKITWDSADLYGVAMGRAELSPSLRNGRLRLPTTEIPALEGAVRFGGVVDLTEVDPTFRLSRKVRVLKQVAVTPELAGSMLSRINPIFLHLTRVEGTVFLTTEGLSLPLGELFKTQASGVGRLDLVRMKVQPDGLLAELLTLGGLPGADQYAVEIGGLDFAIQDGRISYQDFTLTFSKEFNLKFYGSVGLDETLDLVVSLPIGAALLERLGVRGPLSEYARKLTGSRVDIPIIGTRLKPRLDFARVDVESLVRGAVQEEAGRTIGDLLRGLQRDNQKENPDQDPTRRKRRRRP